MIGVVPWSETLEVMPMPDRFPRPVAAIGAIVYPPDQAPEALIRSFAAILAERGFRLGGLIQQTRRGPDGCKCAMELMELDSGRWLSISQDLGKGSASCSLDPAALADASEAVRRAIRTEADVVFINKYSKSEQTGGGLAAEMLETMAAGVPLLTAVSGALIGDWTAFTGGLGDIVMPTMDSLWRWWGPEHLFDDLILGVADHPALDVMVGLTWVLVRGPHGLGVVQAPDRMAPSRRTATTRWRGQSLASLARLARSWDPIEAAVGMAAINAHYNRYDLPAEDSNGLEALGCDPAETVVIGAFPGLAERLPGARVVERRPQDGHFPEDAGQWLLPAAQGVVVTASTLVNRSLPGILRRAATATVALVGPGAPVTPRLFDYGVGVVSGLIATDIEGMMAVVAEGGRARDLKRMGRQATIRKPD